MFLLISPGPNMMFVVTHGATYGWMGGVASALGIGAADLVLADGDRITLKGGAMRPLQNLKRGAVVRVLESNKQWQVSQTPQAEGAVVTLDPATGAIRALVGGFDFTRNQFNSATQAWRQPGSAFKPFVYLAAVEAGYTPQTPVVDQPVTIGNWSPKNYSNTFAGPMPLSQAVAQSINTVAASVADQIGRDSVARAARRLGIDYASARRASARTASGTTPVYLVKLDTVRVGTIELHNVDAAVIERLNREIVAEATAKVADTALAAAKAGLESVQNLNATAAAAQPSAPALQINTVTAAAASAATANNMPSSAVPIDGVAVEIAAQSQNGKNSFEIRLDPQELGRIDVRLDVYRDGNVTTRLIVDRAETLDLLKRDASNIERTLQDAGLKTSDNTLQFSLRDQQSFTGNDRNNGTGATTARIVLPDDDGVPLEAVRSNYGRLLGLGRGVDISI